MTVWEMLRSGLEEIMNEIPPQAVEKLMEYCAMLLEKNKVMNLTAVTEPAGVVTRHFLDCAALAPYMRAHTRVIDVGTGSGAIAIALRKEEAHLQVTASDISEQAVAVARKNAADNAADVTFLTGDMLEPFIEAGIRCDILVSNPPYIPVHEQMEHSVVDFEPHVALFGGEDGLKFYREIFANAHRVIKEKAILAFEMGYDQGERLRALAKEHFPDARVEIIKDLSGKNRMLFVYHNL